MVAVVVVPPIRPPALRQLVILVKMELLEVLECRESVAIHLLKMVVEVQERPEEEGVEFLHRMFLDPEEGQPQLPRHPIKPALGLAVLIPTRIAQYPQMVEAQTWEHYIVAAAEVVGQPLIIMPEPEQAMEETQEPFPAAAAAAR